MHAKKTAESGRKLLNAYVMAKAGKTRQAARLFAEAMSDTSIDPIMDGIAVSIKKLEAKTDDTDNTDDIEDEDVLEDEDVEAGVDEGDDDSSDDMNMDDEEDDEEEVDAEVEIPASVAEVCNLKW